MVRRNFFAAFTTFAASLGIAGEAAGCTVTYHIKGFTCLTCAVGLDTLLRQSKGVIDAKSSYPEAKTTIRFTPALISEQQLKDMIGEMGFSVDGRPSCCLSSASNLS